VTIEEKGEATLDFDIGDVSLTVKVVDEKGAPVQGAQVYYQGSSSSGNTITDDNGQVRIDSVSAGSRMTVYASKDYPDLSSERRTIDVPAAGGDLSETFVLHSYDGEVHCVVTSEDDGKPLDAWVRLLPVNTDTGINHDGNGSNGDIHVSGIPPGDYTMKTSSSGFEPNYKSVHIEAGSRLEFTEKLKVESSNVMVIPRNSSGKNVPGVSCTMISSQGKTLSPAFVPVNANGIAPMGFLFEDITVGQWQIILSAPGFQTLNVPYQASGKSETLSPIMTP
jgi:hypothetical protein